MPRFQHPAAPWQPHIYSPQQLPARWRDWLLDPGSLTRRLQQRWPQDFSLQLLSQRWARPLSHERTALDLPYRRWALIREVVLQGGGQPRIFARSVIPAQTLRQGGPELARLGTRALGELLFKRPTLKRSAFECGPLPGNRFNALLGTDYPEQLIWGRRSLFYLQGEPLLVQEFFLP